MLLDPAEVVLEAPDCLEPDSVLDPDAPVVAFALPSVDDPSVLEPVELGASVIVPLADLDESGDADVREGVSKSTANQYHEYYDQDLSHVPLEDFACLLITTPSTSLSASGHGHAAA